MKDSDCMKLFLFRVLIFCGWTSGLIWGASGKFDDFLKFDAMPHGVKIKLMADPYSSVSVKTIDRVSTKAKLSGDLINLSVELKQGISSESFFNELNLFFNKLVNADGNKIFTQISLTKEGSLLKAILVLNSNLNLRVRKTFGGNVIMNAVNKICDTALNRIIEL